MTFLKVKAVLLSSDAESEGNLVVGDAATYPWSEPFAAAGDQAVFAQRPVAVGQSAGGLARRCRQQESATGRRRRRRELFGRHRGHTDRGPSRARVPARENELRP